MKVKVAIAGYVGDRAVNASGELDLKEAVTVKDLLKALDASGLAGKGTGRAMLRGPQGRIAIVNGRSMPLQEALAWRLSDGDDVSLLSPIAGG